MTNKKSIEGFNLFKVSTAIYIGGARYLKLLAGSKFRGYQIVIEKDYITFSNHQHSELCFDYTDKVELVKLSKDGYKMIVSEKITISTGQLIEELKKVVKKEALGKKRVTYFYEDASL